MRSARVLHMHFKGLGKAIICIGRGNDLQKTRLQRYMLDRIKFKFCYDENSTNTM